MLRRVMLLVPAMALIILLVFSIIRLLPGDIVTLMMSEQAILAEPSLSFLGFGVPPPRPSWGAMLSGSGRTYMLQAPWMAIFPGIAISLAVFGFNMLGDALRDVLDPRLRGGPQGRA